MNDAVPSTETTATREQFLTARQLAASLQVSESTVRRLAREGRIPAIRITSRLTRYHLQSVRDALDGTATHRTRPSHRSTNGTDDSQLSFSDLFSKRNANVDEQDEKK